MSTAPQQQLGKDVTASAVTALAGVPDRYKVY